jgi:hypothetical protein
MGFASRKSQNDLAPISRAPSSGVRARVLPPAAANDSDLVSLEVVPPVVATRTVDLSPGDFDDELQLEDAVPLPTDAALAVVLGFVVVAASGLVAAFSVL